MAMAPQHYMENPDPGRYGNGAAALHGKRRDRHHAMTCNDPVNCTGG